MFDGTFSEKRKPHFRAKLAEFKKKTCVDLIELPWEAGNGPFGGKYKNVFSVSFIDIILCWDFLLIHSNAELTCHI